jgi:acyl carrier protein
MTASDPGRGELAENTHAVVLQVWGEVLGGPVTPTSDFYECGGDSLAAVQIAARVAAALDLPPATEDLLVFKVLELATPDEVASFLVEGPSS